MPIKIKAYDCKFNCGKFLRTHGGMSKHEERCWHDPKKKACISCGHNVQDDEGQGAYCDEFDTELFDNTGNRKHFLKRGCRKWIKNGKH